MKKIKHQLIALATCMVTLIFTSAHINRVADAKLLMGAWGYGTPENKTILVHAGDIFSVATYNITDRKFIRSYGGTWKVDGSRLIRKIEWNSSDTAQVGKEISYDIQQQGDKFSISQTNEKWERLDNGAPGELAGAWIITGNYSNDKVSKRNNPFFPRRTMKVLSGKYFHWIAFNVVSKQFINAGGGVYTTAKGKYTESIEFFTKTAESVGKTMVFDYSFVDGDWRHRGEKSTGGPMDECWSRRETLER